MMNLINAIPESIGWAFVGSIGTTAFFMFSLITKTVIEIIHHHLIDDEIKEN